MHPRLLDLDTKLTILAHNPCACAVCRDATRLARSVLLDVSPLARVLLELPPGTPQFAAAERMFHDAEIGRLQEVYDTVSCRRCLMMPEPVLDQPPAPQIPELPAEASPIVEIYRKQSLGPRLVHRRSRIRPKKSPRVPGSYIIS